MAPVDLADNKVGVALLFPAGEEHIAVAEVEVVVFSKDKDRLTPGRTAIPTDVADDATVRATEWKGA